MTLDEVALKHGTDKSSRMHHYTRFYERFLGKDVKSLLELGVYHGDSIRMWAEWFPDAKIYGVDINEPLDFSPPVYIYKYDQADPKLLELFPEGIEVVVDDASHDLPKTFDSLNLLWPITKKWYCIEDGNWQTFPQAIAQWVSDRFWEIDEFHLFPNLNYGKPIGVCFAMILKK